MNTNQTEKSETKTTTRRLDQDRLKSLVEESRTWPAYMRAELGVKAPSRIETARSIAASVKGQ